MAPGVPNAHDLYLSPHYDDICYSLGNHVAWRGRGMMLVVFSRSDHISSTERIAASRLDELTREKRIAHVSRIRLQEDRRFAATVGLGTAYCGFDEAPIRGRDPFEVEAACEDTARFAEPLMEQIRAMPCGNGESKPVLYCPLGIGGNVDHLVVRGTVLANFSELSKVYTPYFYEDLPYAVDPVQWRAGMRDFAGRVDSSRLRRVVLPVGDFAHKTALVKIYSSQIFWRRPDLEDFTSNVGFHLSQAHEVLWVL